MPYAHITGWGMAVPETILTNEAISKMVDTNDAWIRERTGISERRVAREHDFPSTLGIEASINALRVANLRPTDLDLIICTSSSPEYIFPATACLIQDQLGATKAGAFDLLAACSGFIYALNMGAQAIRSGSIKSALIVGSETLTRFVNWKDRNTCILFGDGAGAFVLQASGDLLSIEGGGSRYPATETTLHEGKHFIQMDGKEVFRFATRVMASATHEALSAAGLTLEDIRWIIPHQANIRIIESAARGLKLPMDRFIVNLERYGNTSTASIPIAMVEALEKGQIQPGDKLVMVGFGAGLTWGALAAQWTGPIPSKGHVRPEQYRAFGRLRSLVRRALRFIEGLLYRREL
jgi:3-oxoacyl-[acyl-carrier-protein] synthase-3